MLESVGTLNRITNDTKKNIVADKVEETKVEEKPTIAKTKDIGFDLDLEDDDNFETF